jgi:endo-1,4-beta-xylanase
MAPTSRGAETLRQVAERGALHVGVMPVDPTWNTAAQKALVEREFNVVTVGAYWPSRRPARNTYDWSVTDAVVNWADGAGLGVHLHPLMWPTNNQNPPWVLESNPAEARAILEEHISTAMTRYRGVVDVWDVVNEATANDGSGGYRDGWWLQALGPSYIVEAFRLARKYDPDAILLYNDYGVELSDGYQTGRWKRVQEILTTLKAENLVDGFGWQLHVTPTDVLGSKFALAERMAWVRQQGLKNFVTELDVAIPAGDEALAEQARAYRKVTEAWLEHHGGGWFQVWGVYDKYSWLGADKRPLLFDESYAPKPAYFEVRDAIGRATSADFNEDGGVDGTDFLAWQHGLGDAYGSGELDRWRAQFPLARSIADAASEPSSRLLWFTTLTALPVNRRIPRVPRQRTAPTTSRGNPDRRHFLKAKYTAPHMQSAAQR